MGMPPELEKSPAPTTPRGFPKGKLMSRVGEEFPLECSNCGGDIRPTAFITEPGAIRKILTHLGEPLAPARGPPTPGPWQPRTIRSLNWNCDGGGRSVGDGEIDNCLFRTSERGWIRQALSIRNGDADGYLAAPRVGAELACAHAREEVGEQSHGTLRIHREVGLAAMRLL